MTLSFSYQLGLDATHHVVLSFMTIPLCRNNTGDTVVPLVFGFAMHDFSHLWSTTIHKY